MKKFITKHYNIFKYFDVRYYGFIIANKIYNIQKTSHNERYIYFYCWRGLLTTIIQTTELLLLGYFIGHIIEMIIAMLCIASVRLYAGGIHARNMFECTVATSIAMVSVIYFGININNNTAITFLVISFILLLIYSPHENKHKPIINLHTRKHYKKMSLIIFLLWIILGFLMKQYFGVITSSLFIECLSIIKLSKLRSAAHKYNIRSGKQCLKES